MKLKLIQLLPDQIARLWGVLKEAIRRSIVVDTTGCDMDVRLNSILLALLDGTLMCFMFCDEDENARVIMTASIQKAIDGGKDVLYINSVFGFGHNAKGIIVDGMRLIVELAKSKGCSAICGATNVKSVIKFAEMTGADTSTTLLIWRI